jgi:hypothetical protein
MNAENDRTSVEWRDPSRVKPSDVPDHSLWELAVEVTPLRANHV